jgi:hypothetical protein
VGRETEGWVCLGCAEVGQGWAKGGEGWGGVAGCGVDEAGVGWHSTPAVRQQCRDYAIMSATAHDKYRCQERKPKWGENDSWACLGCVEVGQGWALGGEGWGGFARGLAGFTKLGPVAFHTRCGTTMSRLTIMPATAHQVATK